MSKEGGRYPRKFHNYVLAGVASGALIAGGACDFIGGRGENGSPTGQEESLSANDYMLSNIFASEISRAAIANLNKIPTKGYGFIRASERLEGLPFAPILTSKTYDRISEGDMQRLTFFEDAEFTTTQVEEAGVNLYSSSVIIPGDPEAFAYRVYEGNQDGFSPLKDGTYSIIWAAEPLGGSSTKADGSEYRFDSSVGVVGVSRDQLEADKDLYLVIFQKQGRVTDIRINGQSVPPQPKDYTPYDAVKLTR